MYNTLFVSSWANLGFDKVDFGSGRPARVMPGKDKMSFPACAMCPRRQAEDPLNVISSMVAEKHVDAFLAEFAKFT